MAQPVATWYRFAVCQLAIITQNAPKHKAVRAALLKSCKDMGRGDGSDDIFNKQLCL